MCLMILVILCKLFYALHALHRLATHDANLPLEQGSRNYRILLRFSYVITDFIFCAESKSSVS